MSTSTNSLAFQAAGPQSAPTIVFLHGGGAGGWMWKPVIQRLPEYHCLAADLPEHGGSQAIAPFSIPLAAEKVAELIRLQAHGGRACVVGLSEGAQVTVQLLAIASELVEKAVISSALLRPIFAIGWAKSPALLAWAYRLSIPPFRNSDWWIRLNMKYAAGIPVEYYPQFKKDFQETTEGEFVHLMVANQTYRLPWGLERARTRALLVAGRHEYPAMRRSLRDMAMFLPHSQAMLLNLGKGSSLAKEHNWALTAPELFARTVRAWIEGLPLPDVLKEM